MQEHFSPTLVWEKQTNPFSIQSNHLYKKRVAHTELPGLVFQDYWLGLDQVQIPLQPGLQSTNICPVVHE